QASAPALREQHDGSFDIGLHFNLTEGFGTETVPSLHNVLLRSYLHLLSPAKLVEQWQRQLDAFEDAMHCAPDFIDGHQHVHQFPLVREAMLTALARYAGHMPWVRSTVAANPAWGGKAKVLQRLGGSRLAQALRQQHIASNHGFAGVYGFDRADYAACLDEWLPSVHAGSLIMCHPGASVDQHDPISAQRLVEYAYLQSEQFPQQLAKHAVCLRRLHDC
ncbi:MAG: ChbG/HpnK family deacetylase, partial [Burkholderiales bacterium]|nr:ChbG/HpnK family deacetylase [Burkholderiales bacterium]